jgi:hypothetical protein
VLTNLDLIDTGTHELDVLTALVKALKVDVITVLNHSRRDADTEKATSEVPENGTIYGPSNRTSCVRMGLSSCQSPGQSCPKLFIPFGVGGRTSFICSGYMRDKEG